MPRKSRRLYRPGNRGLSNAPAQLGPYAERRVLKKIAVDLLTTYVGRRSAEKVYEGALDRGKAEIITATILIADLRGFTRYSDTHRIDNRPRRSMTSSMPWWRPSSRMAARSSSSSATRCWRSFRPMGENQALAARGNGGGARYAPAHNVPQSGARQARTVAAQIRPRPQCRRDRLWQYRQPAQARFHRYRPSHQPYQPAPRTHQDHG